MKKHIVALVPPRFHYFEVAVACEVFGLDRSGLTPDWYQFSLVGLSETEASSDGVTRLSGLKSLKLMEQAHTVIIPGWFDFSNFPDELIETIKRCAANNVRLVSICSGSFVFARAGILSGKRATTHWLHSPALQTEFPDIEVDPNPLFIEAGNIWTSAGTMAGVDLCLELVRRDLGSKVANEVARRMVAPPQREGGQAQYIDRPLPQCDELQSVLDWAGRRLNEPLSVAMLAAKAKMSERTFARKFVQRTGTTPHDWILQARILEARTLLEQTTLSIEDVAEKVGMEGSNFRLRFKERVKITPAKYRASFKQRSVRTA